MIRKGLIFQILLCGVILTNAQSLENLASLRTERDRIPFSVIDGEIGLDIQLGEWSSEGFVKILSVVLRDADLVISFQIDRSINEHYDVQMILEVNDRVIRPGPFDLSNITSSLEDEDIFTRIWEDIAEYHLRLGQQYTLIVEKRLLCQVDCSVLPPEFDIKYKWPHYTGVAVGVGLIGAAQFFRQRKKDHYDLYIERWEDGLENGGQHLQDARQAEKNQNLLTYTGLGISAASALWYVLREKKFNKRKQNYERCCGGREEDLSINPWLPSSHGFAVVGIQLSIPLSRPLE
ncbi:hypothetical protein [Flavilitoribacter nigricans]|uniref:hypothetical protein n=1 Tax=Flavilitoribacter nigricans TaxID=70997 RepID=UPI001179E44B|nr:hypothetical protein [Flavilitoribacter nigricans]